MKKNLLVFLTLLLSVSLFAEVDKCCPAPYDKEFSCEKLPYDFDPWNIYQLQSLFGRASKGYGCNYYYVHELAPIVKLNNCNIGKVVRRFEVDPGSYGEKYICEQEIKIKGHFHYAIEFPKDASANCSVPNADNVKFHQFGCDLLTVNVNDERFRASGDECYKVFRTYRVINWCEFDSENRGSPIVIGRDEDCDGWSGDESVFVIRKEDGTVFIDRDKESYNYDPPQSEIDKSCGHDGYRGYWRSFSIAEGEPYYNRRGYWQYTQIIKVFDNTSPEVAVGEFEEFCTYDNDFPCTGPAKIPFRISENCTSGDLDIQAFFLENKNQISTSANNNIATQVLTGSYPNYELQGVFPVGEHEFLIQVSDGCGSSTSVKIPFVIKDCLAPAPICIETLNAKMEPFYDQGKITGGFKEIWAVDFLASEVKNDCSLPITYSIHRKEAIDSGEETPDPSQQKLTLWCEDLPITIVYVYAWDASGNHDRCQAVVWLQDDNYHCDSPYSHISGFIQTESGSFVENVEVALTGQSQAISMTPTDGRFAFNTLEPGMDYSVTPTKTDRITNGVSTLDLVLISRHILGIQSLDSPYKLIAADVNNSGSITTLDLITLQKAILKIEKTFPGNTSWRFIPKAYVFPDSVFALDMAFPEVANFNDIDSSGVEADFVAVKVGDVSKDVIANQEEKIAPRFVDTYQFEIEDQFLAKEDLVMVSFTLDAEQSIIGTQFTFEFDPQVLTIEEIRHEITSPANFNLHHLEEGWFTFSWHSTEVESGNLFSLAFKTHNSATLSDAITINSKYTDAIAYRSDNSPLQIVAQFIEPSLKEVQLFQNTPNPFSELTTIQFFLPKADQATIRIFTLDGKLLHHTRGNYNAGMNQVELNGEDLPNGIYIYQLQTGTFVQSMKMVIE